EAAIVDDPSEVRTYLQAVTGNHFDAARIEAFLGAIAPMVRELHASTEVRLSVVTSNPDYHPTYPGARIGGRQCYPLPYDLRRLGSHADRLRPGLPEWMPWGMYVAGTEIRHFEAGMFSLRSAFFLAGRILRHLADRALNGRATRLTSGAALVARLARSLFDRNVEIRTSAGVSSLL